MTIAIADTQVSGSRLGADTRPIAALAVTADDLPNLPWEVDEASATRFALVQVDGEQFGLESEDGAPEKQTTVYGSDAGAALDALLAKLGIDKGQVLDRGDRRDSGVEEGVAQVVREHVQKAAAELEGRLIELETRATRLEEERKEAAAVLVRVGAEGLTERQRQTLALLVSGMDPDEVAQVLEISRAAVLRYRREALSHRPPDRSTKRDDQLTAREGQVAALAAQGMSNRDIASALFVTVKTVEWHLKHAYEKLGVRSRDELRTRLAAGSG